MAPAYKLTYFNGKALGESARYLLKYGNIEFEDVRVEHADWPKIKDSTPFGQLPLLERNGRQVGQSIAITRYLGKLVKLAGENEWENLEIDAIVDTINDLKTKFSGIHFEQDPEKKKALRETTLTETLPYYYSRLDKIAEDNNGHLALKRLTWADFYFAAVIGTLDLFAGDDEPSKILGAYKNLAGVKAAVENLPAIKKWIAERPVTSF